MLTWLHGAKSTLHKTLAAAKRAERQVPPSLKELHGTMNELIEIYQEGDGGPELVADAIGELGGQSLLEDRLQTETTNGLLALAADTSRPPELYMELHSGAGGRESADFVRMLGCMYSKWGKRHGVVVNALDGSPWPDSTSALDTVFNRGKGEWKSLILGISSRSPTALGWLLGEEGTHRLVRRSPFDSSGRRHTSFASCSITLPPPFNTVNASGVEALNPSELRIDTFRSSGAGGQHVNVTDSAVRITHLPTGTVASCQNERSQHRNKATALKMLAARLDVAAEQARAAEDAAARAGRGPNSWGGQVRSYVLSPYTSVKDHRSGASTRNADDVLAGGEDLDELFLEGLKVMLLNNDEDHKL